MKVTGKLMIRNSDLWTGKSWRISRKLNRYSFKIPYFVSLTCFCVTYVYSLCFGLKVSELVICRRKISSFLFLRYLTTNGGIRISFLTMDVLCWQMTQLSRKWDFKRIIFFKLTNWNCKTMTNKQSNSYLRNVRIDSSW